MRAELLRFSGAVERDPAIHAWILKKITLRSSRTLTSGAPARDCMSCPPFRPKTLRQIRDQCVRWLFLFWADWLFAFPGCDDLPWRQIR